MFPAGRNRNNRRKARTIGSVLKWEMKGASSENSPLLTEPYYLHARKNQNTARYDKLTAKMVEKGQFCETLQGQFYYNTIAWNKIPGSSVSF